MGSFFPRTGRCSGLGGPGFIITFSYWTLPCASSPGGGRSQRANFSTPGTPGTVHCPIMKPGPGISAPDATRSSTLLPAWSFSSPSYWKEAGFR